MCDSYNITIKKATVETHFFNGLLEGQMPFWKKCF